MRYTLFSIALLTAVLPLSHAVAADDHDFVSCDGYGAPKGKSDGISKATWLWGMASRTADIRQTGTPRLGRSGLGACDRALADARLKTEFVLRKANLLQSKALHALRAGETELALTLADESDLTGSTTTGPYFARSVGLGNKAIRAYAFIALNRQDEAKQQIDAIRATRRWTQSVQQLIIVLEAQIDHGREAQNARLRAGIPLNPRLARGLFWSQFAEGDYGAALETYTAVDFVEPRMRGGWTLEDQDVRAARILEERSSFIGAAAYAAVVLGRPDDAPGLIEQGLREVEVMLTPPAPRANGKPPKQSVLDLYRKRRVFAAGAHDTLRTWLNAIEFRQGMGEKSVEALTQRFFAERLNELPILPDILERMVAIAPEMKAEANSAIEQYRAAMAQGRAEAANLDPDTLMGLLPRPETPGAIPVLKPAGDGYFLSDSGLSREREGQTDVWTIRYTHNVAPLAADEELAMLGAAQTAQKLGFDSFIILNSSSLTRTTNVSQTFGPTYEVNSGYEAQLRVRFVRGPALATHPDLMDWRLISVREVMDELMPRYQSGGITVAF